MVANIKGKKDSTKDIIQNGFQQNIGDAQTVMLY